MSGARVWISREWTTAEEQLLREFYPRIGPAECAAMLERSVTAVRQRAHRLGVTQKDPRMAQRFNFREAA